MRMRFAPPPPPGPSSATEVALVSLPLSPAEFIALTGESIPSSKDVTETKLAHPEKAVPGAIMTLGIALLFADTTT